MVSIGIPTYNRPAGLRTALQCLLGQTSSDLEIIVSDNCSPGDEVGQFMHDLVGRDARVRYFRQEQNIGGLLNFEFVLEQATGKYFMWFADDDMCESSFIEKLLECMEQNPDAVLCACDVRSVDERDNPLETNCLDSIRPDANWGEARRLFFRYPTSNIFFAIYGLYRTTVLKEVGIRHIVGWKGLAMNAEVPFLAELALKGRIVAIPEVLKIYRRHPDSSYYRELRALSPFDGFILRLGIRWRLCKIALRGGNTPSLKLSLLASVIASGVMGIRARGIIALLLPAGLKKQIKRLCR